MNKIKKFIALDANKGVIYISMMLRIHFKNGHLNEYLCEFKCILNYVYKLKKTIYGLKQSQRAWFTKLYQYMIKIGYDQSLGDETLFMKHLRSRKIVIFKCLHKWFYSICDDDEEIKKLDIIN